MMLLSSLRTSENHLYFVRHIRLNVYRLQVSCCTHLQNYTIGTPHNIIVSQTKFSGEKNTTTKVITTWDFHNLIAAKLASKRDIFIEDCQTHVTSN